MPGIKAKSLFVTLCLLALPQLSVAQTDGILQHDDPATVLLDRLQTIGLLPKAFISHRPLSIYEAKAYLAAVDTSALESSWDRSLLRRLTEDSVSTKPNLLSGLIPQLYTNGTDFLSTKGSTYRLQLNPLLYLTAGTAVQSAIGGRQRNKFVWQNTRGIRLSGSIGKYVFFESRLEENQRAAPEIAREWIVRRLGRVNDPRTTTQQLLAESSFDYFVATGIVALRVPHFELRLGRDRNEWGFSRSSLTLSPFSHTYDQLQIRTTVGPFQYVSLYSALSDRSASEFEAEVPPKFGVFHRLEAVLARNLHVGLFESVVFTPDEPSNAGSYFGFLNPIIFYRALDGDIGSPGNVLVGFDVFFRAFPGISTHMQVAFDEFNLSKLVGEPDWWKNTYGLQLGVRTADLLVAGLDLSFEYTRIRPYMYSNRTASLGYVNSRGVLGHPAGPNAEDLVWSARYRPRSDVELEATLIYTRRGLNTADRNFGSNPSLPYNQDRVDEDGNPLLNGVRLLQGIRESEWLLESRVSWNVWPSAFLETGLRYQSVSSEVAARDRYVNPFVQLRWGLPFQGLR